MFGRLGLLFARLGSFVGGESGLPASGESDESLAQLDSGGITLIQLGMI